jgi:hypothetical protein
MRGCVCVDRTVSAMNRNTAYLIIGVLAAAVVFLSYQLYLDRQPQRVDLSFGSHGISIEKH